MPACLHCLDQLSDYTMHDSCCKSSLVGDMAIGVTDMVYDS